MCTMFEISLFKVGKRCTKRTINGIKNDMKIQNKIANYKAMHLYSFHTISCALQIILYFRIYSKFIGKEPRILR
jgi:hypothetical protein